MSEADSIQLRLVEADEEAGGDGAEKVDKFAPLGINVILASAFELLKDQLTLLEKVHRAICFDGEYQMRKGQLLALVENPDANGLTYMEFENAFYWLHGAVSGYFDQTAKNHAGSTNSYLLNSFESLLMGRFATEKTRYFHEAIEAAAALVVLGLLPAGIRQIHAEYRSHVARKIFAIIRDARQEHAFRYIPDSEILKTLSIPHNDLEVHFKKQRSSADQAVPLAIFAIRARMSIPDTEAAARITSMAQLSLVKSTEPQPA